MLRKPFVVAIAVLGLSLAGVASAATVTANYDFVPGTSGSVAVPNTSHYDTLSPVFTPNYAPVTGNASVSFQVDQNGNPINGAAATLDSLTFDVNFGAAGFVSSFLGLSGVVHAALVAPVTTTWSAGTLAPVSGTIHVSGTVNCSSDPTKACSYIGYPPSVLLNLDFPAPASFQVGFGFFSGTVPLTIVYGPITEQANVVLSGVPEPGTLLLLGAGLAGLVAAGRWRRS